MELYTIEDQGRLQRIRDFYERRNTAEVQHIETADCLETIHFLLRIIGALELSPFRQMVPQLTGHIVYIRGVYESSTNKTPTVLQFVHFSETADRPGILKKIQEKYGNSLLSGFEIADIQYTPIEDKTILIGTGFGG